MTKQELMQKLKSKIEINIEHDMYPESPRDWSEPFWIFIGIEENGDNFGDLEVSMEEVRSQSSAKAVIEDKLGKRLAYIRKVYGYKHGNVLYKADNEDESPFTCEFDSGFAGWAVLTLEEQIQNYAHEMVTAEERAGDILDSELEEYSNWCNGEVYQVTINTVYLDDDGNELYKESEDQSGGYYVYEQALEEARAQAEDHNGKLIELY